MILILSTSVVFAGGFEDPDESGYGHNEKARMIKKLDDEEAEFKVKYSKTLSTLELDVEALELAISATTGGAISFDGSGEIDEDILEALNAMFEFEDPEVERGYLMIHTEEYMFKIVAEEGIKWTLLQVADESGTIYPEVPAGPLGLGRYKGAIKNKD